MGLFKVERIFNLLLTLYMPRRLSQTPAHHTEEVLSHLQLLPLHTPKLHAARSTRFGHSHLSSPSITPDRPENAAAPGATSRLLRELCAFHPDPHPHGKRDNTKQLRSRFPNCPARPRKLEAVKERATSTSHNPVAGHKLPGGAHQGTNPHPQAPTATLTANAPQPTALTSRQPPPGAHPTAAPQRLAGACATVSAAPRPLQPPLPSLRAPAAGVTVSVRGSETGAPPPLRLR